MNFLWIHISISKYISVHFEYVFGTSSLFRKPIRIELSHIVLSNKLVWTVFMIEFTHESKIQYSEPLGPFEKTHKLSIYIYIYVYTRNSSEATIFWSPTPCTLSRVVRKISKARMLRVLLFYVLFVTCSIRNKPQT